MNDAVGEIGRVLADPPSQLGFRALCAALRRGGSSEELLALCEQGLAEWPDEIRTAPWSWLAALGAGQAVPGWSLVRSLALGTPQLGVADPPFPQDVQHITTVDLGGFATEHLNALVADLGRWENLRVLTMRDLSDLESVAISTLAASPSLDRLESLDLIDVRETLFHFTPPPFRPPVDRPLRLRHAGLRAPDLIHLLQTGTELRSATVLITSIDEARELAARPELAQLERLTLGFRCAYNGQYVLGELSVGNVIPEDDAACTAFFAAATLTGLRELGLYGIQLGPGRDGLGAQGLAAVAASGIISQLTAITIDTLPLGDAALIDVIAALDHDRIESVTLRNVVLSDRTAEAFTETYSALRNLDLAHNYLTESGAQHLAHDVDLPALERLDLSGEPGGSPYYARSEIQPIGDAGAVAWASSHNAVNLTELRLAATGLTPAAVPELVTTGELETLDLSYNLLNGWPTVERLPGRSLNLAACGLDDDDVEKLVTAEADLDSLDLAYNSISSATALVTWSVVRRLWELDLHDNHLDDTSLTGLGAVADCLLELDLQQDCWKLDRRPYGESLPPAIADPAYFPNLDTIVLGVVDEYHGARYGAGYPPAVREQLRTDPGTRRTLVAFLTYLRIDEELTTEQESRADRAARDFRHHLRKSHAEYEAQARAFARRLQLQ